MNVPNAIVAPLRMPRTYAILLVIALGVGAFLRLDDFTNRIRFNNDQVRDTTIVMDILARRDIPLLGPKAGGTTFQLGPAFYYLLAASGAVFGATPEGIAAIIPILSIASLFLLYVVLRWCFTPRIAGTLTLLAATSFFLIKYSRFVWNPNMIPFFLLLFIVALLRTMETPLSRTVATRWWVLLAVSAGIGMQLHTTLFIIMPLTILIMHGIRRYLHAHPLPVAHLFATFALIGLLLAPMILSDLHSGGANASAFFAGSAKKTSLGSVVDNAIHVGQFFGQGSVYILTGTEPTRDWTAPRKLLADPQQLILAALGIALCTAGIIVTIIALRHSTSTRRTHILAITLCMIVLHILLLLPIGDTLQTRFFLTLFFVPFIWIGLLYEHIMHHLHTAAARRTGYSVAIAIVALLIGCNIATYRTTYAFDPATKNSSLYGGISLGELRGITDAMAQVAPSDATAYILPHAYGRSVRFIAQQRSDLQLTTADTHDIPAGATAFFLSDKTDVTLSDDITASFAQQDHLRVQRWHVIVLRKL